MSQYVHRAGRWAAGLGLGQVDSWWRTRESLKMLLISLDPGTPYFNLRLIILYGFPLASLVGYPSRAPQRWEADGSVPTGQGLLHVFSPKKANVGVLRSPCSWIKSHKVTGEMN